VSGAQGSSQRHVCNDGTNPDGHDKVARPRACYASSIAAVRQVNDLDLTVRAAGLAGYTLYGNGDPDHLNNVEQAGIPCLCTRLLCVGNSPALRTPARQGLTHGLCSPSDLPRNSVRVWPVQVALDDLDPGVMVITVSLTTLVYQQRYSLVVQVYHAGCLVALCCALRAEVIHHHKLRRSPRSWFKGANCGAYMPSASPGNSNQTNKPDHCAVCTGVRVATKAS